MFVFIFFIAILNTAESQCISLDQGFNEYWNGTLRLSCSNGQQIEETIQFKQEFCEPPKIIIRSISYYQRNSLTSFSLKILTSTTTKFQVQLQCNLFSSVSKFAIYWAALIEDRILVFNDFMQSINLIDGYRTSVIPYPQQNKVYEISYSIISYSGGVPEIIIEKQDTGFNLYVTGVSSTQLSGLGVQIIAGLQSLYTLYDSYSFQQCNLNAYFLKMVGFIYQPNQIIIVGQQNFADDVQSISYDNFNATQGLQRITLNQNCTSSVIINLKLYLYDFKYFPHNYKKIRVAQMMSLDYLLLSSFDTQRLYFKEIDQTWIDTNIPSSTFEYNQGIISLVYSHQCQPRRKITVTILRKGQQGFYDYIYSLYCHRSYNLITMYIYLQTSNFDSSELQISLTDSGVQIQEKILQTRDTYQIFNIQYPV